MEISKKIQIELPTRLPVYYILKGNSQAPKQLNIFLHGYTDSAESFLKRAIGDAQFDAVTLAVDGPFPVPVRTPQGFQEAFSWYFEDHSNKRVIIPKQVSIDLLSQLISELKLDHLPKTIVGFSQGGFLAPKLAEQISKVEKIIGIGCAYRKESYQNIGHIRVYGVHGSEDSIVDYQDAKESFKLLQDSGVKGEFVSIEDMGHIINDEARESIKKFILI